MRYRLKSYHGLECEADETGFSGLRVMVYQVDGEKPQACPLSEFVCSWEPIQDPAPAIDPAIIAAAKAEQAEMDRHVGNLAAMYGVKSPATQPVLIEDELETAADGQFDPTLWKNHHELLHRAAAELRRLRDLLHDSACSVGHWRTKATRYGNIVRGCEPALRAAGFPVVATKSDGAFGGIERAVESLAGECRKLKTEVHALNEGIRRVSDENSRLKQQNGALQKTVNIAMAGNDECRGLLLLAGAAPSSIVHMVQDVIGERDRLSARVERLEGENLRLTAAVDRLRTEKPADGPKVVETTGTFRGRKIYLDATGDSGCALGDAEACGRKIREHLDSKWGIPVFPADPTPKQPDRCDRCQFWEAFARCPTEGLCRIDPPRTGGDRWPVTLGSEKCGRFEKKEAKQ